MSTYRVMKLAKDGKPIESRLFEADSKGHAIDQARIELKCEPEEGASLRAVLVPE